MTLTRRAFLGCASCAFAARFVPSGRALAQCENENDHMADAEPWHPEPSPTVPRRSASKLPVPEVEKLRRAYMALSKLPTKDPRSIGALTLFHCAYCGGDGTKKAIHGNWRFLFWHRAALYFHERLLGYLISDTSLRLPYWSWDADTDVDRHVPLAYAEPASADNPLYDGSRKLKIGLEDLGKQLDAAMVADLFGDFGGDSHAGAIEAPHNLIHAYVGGHMADLRTAATDPIFFAHHANVDRLWTAWTAVNPNGRKAVLGGSEDDQSFTFVDERGKWRKVRALDFLEEQVLGYSYDDASMTRWKELRAMGEPIALPATSTSRPSLEQQRRQSRVRVDIRGLELGAGKTVPYELFFEKDGAAVGQIAVLGSAHGSSKHRWTQFIDLAQAEVLLRSKQRPRISARPKDSTGPGKNVEYESATLQYFSSP